MKDSQLLTLGPLLHRFLYIDPCTATPCSLVPVFQSYRQRPPSCGCLSKQISLKLGGCERLSKRSSSLLNAFKTESPDGPAPITPMVRTFTFLSSSRLAPFEDEVSSLVKGSNQNQNVYGELSGRDIRFAVVVTRRMYIRHPRPNFCVGRFTRDRNMDVLCDELAAIFRIFRLTLCHE